MNKKELIDAIAKTTGQYKKDIAVTVDGLLYVLSNELIEGNEIALQGFGKFSVTTRPPRMLNNPRTGEYMQIGETRNVKFTQSSNLKEALANGRDN